MPRKCMPAELSVRERAILDLLTAAEDGIAIAEVAKRIGLLVGRTGELLRRLRNRGMACVVGSARTAVWVTPANAERLRLARAPKPAPEKRSIIHARESMVLSVIDKAPTHGLRGCEVAQALKLTDGQVRWVLRSLRDRGVLDTTGGAMSRWLRAEDAKKVRLARYGMNEREAAEAARRERRRQADRRRSEAANEAFLVIRHSIVPAADCQPLRPAGPPSVFQMRA